MNENMLERINLPLTIGKEHRKETDSRISRLFLESGNLENIYRKLPGMLADRFGFRHVLIERYHPDSDSLAIEGVEWDGYSKTDFNKIPVIDTVFSRAIRSGRTEFLQPDEIDAGDAHPLINGPGIREIICIPLKAKSMVLGMLILAGDQPVGESKKTMVSLKLISHHLSLEIEQENSRFQLIQAQSLLKRQNQIFESIFSTTHFMLVTHKNL